MPFVTGVAVHAAAHPGVDVRTSARPGMEVNATIHAGHGLPNLLKYRLSHFLYSRLWNLNKLSGVLEMYFPISEESMFHYVVTLYPIKW